jgi:hypothetical protein
VRGFWSLVGDKAFKHLLALHNLKKELKKLK